MNWETMYKKALVPCGSTLTFHGKNSIKEATVTRGGNISCEQQTFKRPSTLWATLFRKESRKKSWLDACFFDGRCLRSVRNTTIVARSNRITPSKSVVNDVVTPLTRSKSRKRKKYQLSLRSVGRPKKIVFSQV